MTTLTPMTAATVASFSRDEIRDTVRAAIRESEFTKYRAAKGFPEHSGQMLKSQWIEAWHDIVDPAGTWHGGTYAQTPDPRTPDTPDTPDTVDPDPVTPDTPDTVDPFADADKFIAPAVLDPMRAAYDAARKAQADAEKRASDAEKAAEKAKRAPAPSPAPVASPDAPSPASVASPYMAATFVGMHNLCDVMPGRTSNETRQRNIQIPVYDFDAHDVDPLYIWPVCTPDVLTAATCGFSVALYGSKGTGKSSFWRNVAAMSKRPYIEIAFHGEISHADLFGFEGPAPDGGTQWVDGDLLTAIKTPGAIVDCAEIAKSRPDMVTALNSVFEANQRRIFAGGVWHDFAPDVWLVATSNDPGTGETAGQYHGIKPMDESLRSRLVWQRLELPSASQLSRMLVKVAGVPKEAADMAAQFETQLSRSMDNGDCETTPGFRALVAWAKMTKSGVDPKTAFDMAALNSAIPEDRAAWADAANANFDFPVFGAHCRGETPVATRDGFTATE